MRSLVMVGGAMAGSGMEKALGLVLSDWMVFRLLLEGADGGGGALRVGVGGSVASGGGAGGAGGKSVETVSPVAVKSGGSTYLLKSTLPPKRTMRRRWMRAETVRKREARIGRRNRSKWDFGWSGICSGWGKRNASAGGHTQDKGNVNEERASVEQK